MGRRDGGGDLLALVHFAFWLANTGLFPTGGWTSTSLGAVWAVFEVAGENGPRDKKKVALSDGKGCVQVRVPGTGGKRRITLKKFEEEGRPTLDGGGSLTDTNPSGDSVHILGWV